MALPSIVEGHARGSKKKKKDRDRESHYIYASADTKLDLLMLIDSLDQIDHEFVIDTD
jgi:molecular chaperone GrpE (heat shock protein)